jgi:RHS repeat-associated protein
LGWDSVGHLVATRSALVSESALVNPAVANLVATLDYDDRGRAAVLREAAPSAGANRVVQRITFPQISEAAAISGATVIAKVDSTVGADAWAKTVEFDAGSQVVTGGTDRAGNKVTVVTDNFGRPQRIVDPEKRITTYAYDETGLQTGQAGPFTGDADRGLVLDANYDSTVDGSRTVAWTGMNARVFTRVDYAGDASGAWWGKSDRSGLGFNWTAVPDGAQGQWSARATAKWTPTSTARDWALRVDANGAQVSVLIDGELCVADGAGRCEIAGLSSGPKSVVVQVNKASARGGFRVLAAPLGDEPVLIPAAQVEPLFGVATVQALNDTYPGSERNPQTVKEFSKPWDETVSSTTSPGGLTMEQTVEAIDPANDRWGRPLTRTTPGGKLTTFSYYANGGAAAAPDVCGGGAAVPQYGATRSVVRQDGTSEQRIFNARGQIIAKVTNGVAGSVETTCVSYDDAGRIISSRTFNTADALIEATVTDPDVDGKPWITSTKVTHGPASPVTPGATYTSTTEVDMAGRVVRFADGLGTVTTTTYTDEGKPKVVVITAPASVSGSGRVMRFAFTYTDAQDWLNTVTLNGVQVAKVNYDTNIGRVQSVEYANGTSVSYEYFGNGRPDKQTIVHAGGRVVNAVDFKGTGRSMGSTINSTGSSVWTESRQYGYDEAGRLISTVIASTQPGAPASTNFTYGYGAQARTCAAGYTGAGADSLRVGGSRNGVDYVTCHDATGKTTSTTDPLITAGTGIATLTHDRQGRVTRIDSAGRDVSLTWGAGTQLATLADGDTLTSLNTFAGVLRDKTVTTDTTTSRIFYGYSGPAANPAAKSDGSSDPLASAAPSPTMTYTMTGNVPTSVASAVFDLPGGAQVAIPSGAKAVMTLSDLEGAALVTLPVAALGTGSASDLVPSVGPAPRFGPYGEALVAPTFTTATPHYGWQNAAGMDTLAGASSITLMGVRPYLPALGEFLAKDPDFNSGMNLYAYTSGDPINRQDLSGESETLNTVSLWMGIGGMLAGFFGPAGMAIGALAAIGSAVVQGIAIAQQDEKPSVAQWIGVGATAFFGVAGGWSSIKALKDLKWFVGQKSKTLQARGGEFSTKNKAVSGACAFSWGCAAAVRTEGVRIRQTLMAENPAQANRGLMQGGVIQGRKGFILRLFAPGG